LPANRWIYYEGVLFNSKEGGNYCIGKATNSNTFTLANGGCAATATGAVMLTTVANVGSGLLKAIGSYNQFAPIALTANPWVGGRMTYSGGNVFAAGSGWIDGRSNANMNPNNFVSASITGYKTKPGFVEHGLLVGAWAGGLLEFGRSDIEYFPGWVTRVWGGYDAGSSLSVFLLFRRVTPAAAAPTGRSSACGSTS
jgi:hypothetical protein